MCDGFVFPEMGESIFLEWMWGGVYLIDRTEILGADFVDYVGAVGLVSIFTIFEEA